MIWPNTIAGNFAWLDTIAVLITHYGIFLILACVLLSKDKKVILSAGLTFVITLVIDFVINLFLFIPRPFTVGASEALIPQTADSTFPSGHTMRAFSLSQPVLIHKKVLGITATILAILVAVSRVYLGLHYWTDVIAGAVISIAAAYGVHYAIKKKVLFNKLKF